VWAQAVAARGQELEFSEGGNPEVQLIDAFAVVERKLEAAMSATPAGPLQVCCWLAYLKSAGCLSGKICRWNG